MKKKSFLKRTEIFARRFIDKTAVSFLEGAVDLHFIASHQRKCACDGLARRKYCSKDKMSPLFHYAGTIAALAGYTMGSDALQREIIGESSATIILAGMAVPVITNLFNRLREERRREKAQKEVDLWEDVYTSPSTINYDG